MNILMVSDVYFPRINGVSTSIETFRECLRRDGHRVILVAPDYGHGAPVVEPDVIRIGARPVPFDPEDRLMAHARIVALAARLRGEQIDLVHVQTPFVAHYAGMRLARELGIPCVATYHTFFEEYLFHYVRWLPRAWLRALARRFSRGQCNQYAGLIVPSSAMRDALLRYGVHTAMEVLPTGIPLAQFGSGDGAAFRRAHGIAAERPMALFVGRVAFEKNIGFLLEVAERARTSLPELLLVIAGEGPALAQLQQQARTMKLEHNVMFVGYLDRRVALPDCYAAADAFVFASRTETQGLVLLEAMAAGIPVVALAEMGTRDILEARRGALVPPDDPRAFAETLVGLLCDGTMRARLSREAHEFAVEWNAPELARRLTQFYRQVRDGGTPLSCAPAQQIVT